MVRFLHPKLPGAQGHHQASEIVILTLLRGTIGYTMFKVTAFFPLRVLLLLVAGSVTVHVLGIKTLTREMLSESSGIGVESE
jgi:hypothetical protein